MSDPVEEIPPPPKSARRAADVWSRPKANDDEGDLDMTPMVDVTFLLLIFFMITAAFALQKAISVPPSDDSAAAEPTVEELEDDSIVVRVDGDNIYWVICPAWAEEQKAISKQDMRNLVRAGRRGAPPGGTAPAGTLGYSKLLVQASGDATHEYVVGALDAGSGAGVEEIRLMKIDDEY